MARVNAKLKRGMKGSNCGRGRWAKTADLKNDSKKARRQEGKEEGEMGVLEMDIEIEQLAELNATIAELLAEAEALQSKIIELTEIRSRTIKMIRLEEDKI